MTDGRPPARLAMRRRTGATTVSAIPGRRRRSTWRRATRSPSSKLPRARAAGDAKGPTGCGKTRFVEHMAWRLGRPLVTVACHDDLSASDLTGRYLIRGSDTVWLDGPLTLAAQARRHLLPRRDHRGAAGHGRRHPSADRRPADPAARQDGRDRWTRRPGFQLVVSYNPGYQHGLKDLKPSTRQRFVALEFGFPAPELEAAIVAHEGGVGARHGRRAGHADQSPAPTRRPRPGRGAEHAADRRDRAARRQRHPDAGGVPRGAARAADRRSGSAGRHARSGERDDVVENLSSPLS